MECHHPGLGHGQRCPTHQRYERLVNVDHVYVGPSTNLRGCVIGRNTDLIWSCIVRHVTDETGYRAALDGARECVVIDRAFRGAIALAMRDIEG